MLKMFTIFKDEILQLQSNKEELNLDLMNTKYEALNTKILSAIKQVDNYLKFHGIELDKSINAEEPKSNEASKTQQQASKK